jgi:ubiquitin-activating enzyme E1-like protein
MAFSASLLGLIYGGKRTSISQIPQVWSYITPESVDAVAASGFFNPVAGKLAIGDEIKVSVVNDVNPATRTSITAKATLTVTAVSPTVTTSNLLDTYQISVGGSVSRSISSRLSEQPSILDFIPTTYHSAITTKTQTNPMDSYIQTALYGVEGPLSCPAGLIPLENPLLFGTQNRGFIGAGEGYGFIAGIPTIQASAATRFKWIGDTTRTVNAITKANPGQITLTADAPSSWITGKKVVFRTISAGMTELNCVRCTLTKIDARTFTIGIDTSGYTDFSGTCVIVDGGAMFQAAAPQNSIVLTGLTFQNIMIDCNGFTMGGGIELLSTSNNRLSRVCIFAPASYGLKTGTVDYALVSPFGAYGTQASIFEQVFVSTFGGSGEYLTSKALGFWLTSGSGTNFGNTSLNFWSLCHAHMSKGRAWYLESCDDNFFYSCLGASVRDLSLAPMELASSAQDSYSLDGGAARYNMAFGTLMQAGINLPGILSRNGGNPAHDNLIIGNSRADVIGVPSVEAGSTLHEIDSNGNMRVNAGQALFSPTNLQTFYVRAADMTPTTTNGAGAYSVESTTNKNMINGLAFDQTTAEFAQFSREMPKSWDKGTITFRTHWTAPASSGGVVWTLRAGAFSDGDALDVALGSPLSVADTLLAVDEEHIQPESTPVTVGGTPATKDRIIFQISRTPANVLDTLANDAVLLGVMITYTALSLQEN